VGAPHLMIIITTKYKDKTFEWKFYGRIYLAKKNNFVYIESHGGIPKEDDPFGIIGSDRYDYIDNQYITSIRGL
jgi:hypothetical protein